MRVIQPDGLPQKVKVKMLLLVFDRDNDGCLGEVEFFVWQGLLKKRAAHDGWVRNVSSYNWSYGLNMSVDKGKAV